LTRHFTPIGRADSKNPKISGSRRIAVEN
jgi:hypothetical protein